MKTNGLIVSLHLSFIMKPGFDRCFSQAGPLQTSQILFFFLSGPHSAPHAFDQRLVEFPVESSKVGLELDPDGWETELCSAVHCSMPCVSIYIYIYMYR